MSWRQVLLLRGLFGIGLSVILLGIVCAGTAWLRADASFVGVGLPTPENVYVLHTYASVPFHIELGHGRYVALACGGEIGATTVRIRPWDAHLVLNVIDRGYGPDHINYFPAAGDIVIPAWWMFAIGLAMIAPTAAAVVCRCHQPSARGFPIGSGQAGSSKGGA